MRQDESDTPSTLTYDAATPRSRRPAIGILIVTALIHFAAFVAVSYFIRGRPLLAPRSAIDRAADVAFWTLSFPMLQASMAVPFRLPGAASWLFAAANSVLWGLVVWLAVWLFRRMRPAA